MKNNISAALGLYFALALIGCQGGATATSTDPANPHAQNGSSTGQATPPSNSPTGKPEEKPPASAAKLPENLMTDAYHWYGLGNDKPMKISIQIGDRAPATGTQTIHVKSVEGGKVIFDIQRDGELEAEVGSDTVALESDGVYTIRTAKIDSALHNLELPAKLPVGATWKNTGTYNKGSATEMSQDQTFRVVGPQKVTTLAGAEDALLITSTGTLTLNKQKSRVTASLWYVKDKGLVKNVLQMWTGSGAKAKPQTITIQETK